jgi:hypothetical protein
MLFQEIHYKKLVKYQTYYFTNNINKIIINMRGEYIGKVNNKRIFNVIGSTKKFRKNPEPWVIDIIHDSFFTEMWVRPMKTKFYSKITKKEYTQKLREKFEQTALKIVLKRIVNEDFEWI